MPRTLRWLIASMALGALVWLLLGRGTATGQNEPWQPILSMEVYQVLTKREAELIQELLKDTPKKQALNRARFGAVLIAALAMSVKEGSPGEDLRGTRGTALLLAKALGNKVQIAVARKLAAQLANAKADPDAKTGKSSWGDLIDAPTLMVHFLPKNEGGDGIHPDLQRSAKLQGSKNGILEKIRDLTANELNAADIKKEAKELELFGYRSAVIGSLVYHLVPAKMKTNKTPQEWRTLATEMRDHSVSLAVAAREGDAAAVLKASTSLRSACSRCHNVF